MHLNKMVHQDSKLNNMQIYFPDNKSLHAKIYDKLYGTMQYALTALGKVIFEKSAVSSSDLILHFSQILPFLRQ
jgi:hypothetical protein